MKYTIKDAAEQLNISIYTIRYYDKMGLMPFLKREESGTRIFTEADIEWLAMITSLREIDMPIARIQDYIELLVQGDETVKERCELIEQYRAYMEDKMNAMRKCLDITTQKLNEYDKEVIELLTARTLAGKK